MSAQILVFPSWHPKQDTPEVAEARRVGVAVGHETVCEIEQHLRRGVPRYDVPFGAIHQAHLARMSVHHGLLAGQDDEPEVEAAFVAGVLESLGRWAGYLRPTGHIEVFEDTGQWFVDDVSGSGDSRALVAGPFGHKDDAIAAAHAEKIRRNRCEVSA